MLLTILKQVFINLLIPVATKTISEYIKTTDTKKDDKLLEVSKLAIDYLAEQSNNTITKEISNALSNCNMITCQKSKS